MVLGVAETAMNGDILAIRNLEVDFGTVRVVRGINLNIGRGEAVGIVGESGCGKSVTWLAALGLLPRSAAVRGEVLSNGENLVGAPERILNKVRGRRISMIFQDPMSALNPVKTIGQQIAEVLYLHRGMTGMSARREVQRMLDLVGMPDSARRIDAFPHELSGGQCQRAMIAMAISGKPEILIADEPTTALDVTIQAQILELLIQLRRELGMALVLVSHDLGVISEICERVYVMYAGRVIESASSRELFEMPRHPYTRGLIDALPSMDGERRRLRPIPGNVPEPWKLPKGCSYAPRCERRVELCLDKVPPLENRSEHHGEGLRELACFSPIGAQLETESVR